MSRLFEQGIDKIKHFEQQSNFEKNFTCFTFDNQKFIEATKRDKNIPFVGFGGVPLSGTGNDGKEVFVDSSDSHTLIIGPTGSKKSRLIAMPTIRMLGAAKESMIICDPKAEIFERTAGYLEDNGYEIYVLNLRNPNIGSCWNPLAIAYSYYTDDNIDKAYEFVNDVATNLALMDESKSTDPFWDNSFASLFLGLTMLLFRYCRDTKKPHASVNIGNLIELRKQMFDNKNLNYAYLWAYAQEDSSIETALIGTITAPENTQRCILATFDQKMRIFTTQPNLVRMLSNNTIRFDDIINKPTAVFLVLPDEKTSFHGLVSLFVKQSYEYIISKLQELTELTSEKPKMRVNYVLDEFSSLPAIKDFAAMITAARSRNIRFNIIIQSKHQLLLRYKNDTDTIQSNCNNWIFLTSRELELLDELSRLGGNIYDGGTVKPVLAIDDLQRLDKVSGEVLVFSGRFKPIVTKLPDIDVYDNKSYRKIHLEEREHSTIDVDLIKFVSPNLL